MRAGESTTPDECASRRMTTQESTRGRQITYPTDSSRIIRGRRDARLHSAVTRRSVVGRTQRPPRRPVRRLRCEQMGTSERTSETRKGMHGAAERRRGLRDEHVSPLLTAAVTRLVRQKAAGVC
uniref:Uncharacterized protein n=1 Tax=Plectus sambesii TaxID=2011161 RepID=A0A914UUB7_9BILA